MITRGMSASRIYSSAANTRAINAAKTVSRLSRLDSILTRLGTVSQEQELVGAMLERVLNSDPVLAQKLPVAIAIYCTENKHGIPGSVADAVRVIGYGEVRKIVQIVGLSCFVEEIATRVSMNAKHLLSQAVAVGIGAEFLLRKTGQPSAMAFSAGLFANVGVPTLALAEREYEAITSSVGGGSVQLHEAEKKALGCTHMEVGWSVLTDHAFPEIVALGASAHADTTHANMTVKAVALSEAFAHQLGYDGGFAIVPPEFDPNSLATFGCSESETMALAELVTRWTSLTFKMLA
ncbi:MAG: HDOD domain-containing protein [Armatimonadetes bacterium]|nr:HDOD domain-containing protein [Armatimonadota bacterium]